jgi:tetratricopeptide (TPR) repeat protein
MHVLIGDVAYAQLPRGKRAALHVRAAGWIESLGRPEDHAEMLAHHYLEAIELSNAAGLDTAPLIEPARLALREAGDRAAALYATNTAERFYYAALRLWPEDDPERADLLYRGAIPVGHHVGGGDPERLAEARDALLAAGDNDRAAELETSIGEAFWLQGNGTVADEHGARALALLGDGPPTRSRAFVLARAASRAYKRDEYPRALELASEACAAAEQVGSKDGLSDALNLQGMIRLSGGDMGGLDDLEQSVVLASATGALGVQTRVLNNLAVGHQLLGDLGRGFAIRLKGARIAEQLGSESAVRWYQSTLADHRYRRGDWDDALRIADEFLGLVESGTPHVGAWQVFAIRAEIRLARGDRPGALADTEHALAAARAVGDVQATTFAVAGSAHVFALASEEERAATLALELLDFLDGGGHMQFAVINLPAFACAAARLGVAPRLVEALAGHPKSRWTEAVNAYVSGDFARAAELLAQAGARPDEAEARVRAGGEQTERGLAFYRTVGAVRYIHEAGPMSAL